MCLTRLEEQITSHPAREHFWRHHAKRRRPFGARAAWIRSLQAENKSQKTIETYSEAARVFTAFLVRKRLSTDAGQIAREHVESFTAKMLQRFKPATASNRHRALSRLFDFLVEGELDQSPMVRMKPAAIPETSVAVVTNSDHPGAAGPRPGYVASV
jgi:site-specific recombinase XerD